MIGSIISAANDVKQGYWQNAFNMVNAVQSIKQNKLQREAFEWQKNYDLNQTQIRVDDMAKAGLNPILAAGGSGASSVAGVSAQNANGDVSFGQLNALKELDLQENQLKQNDKIAEESNETAKDVAETNAAASKYVADKQAETATSNAVLQAQTQTAIAASNNEALKGVRSSQERNYNASSQNQEHKNKYNERWDLYDGNPTTPVAYGHSIAISQLSKELKNKYLDNYNAYVKDCVQGGLKPLSFDDYIDYHESRRTQDKYSSHKPRFE